MYTPIRSNARVSKLLTKSTAFCAVFLLLLQPVIIYAQDDINSSDTPRRDMGDLVSERPEVSQDYVENLTPGENPRPSTNIEEETISSLFKKDENNSVREELIRVRRHLLGNKAPAVAIDRLNAYEEKLINSQNNKGLVKKINTAIKNLRIEIIKAKAHEKLIERKPFEIEGFTGGIHTLEESKYDNNFKNGKEKLKLIESVKSLIENKIFLKDDNSFTENLGILKPEKVYAGNDNPDDYLSEGEEIVFSQAIEQIAQTLNSDPLNILNFVSNEIGFTPYYGSKKGADATLAELTGNDMDKSSLLIALLRASDIPARYRHVDMRIDVGTLNNLFGTNDAIRTAEIMSLEKIPYTLYTLNGDPYFFVVEHVYVEAYIPYGYSRGLDITDGGTLEWVPMEPTINSYDYLQSVDVISEMVEDGFNISTFFDNYISGNYGIEEPVEAFRGEVENYIENTPFEYYEDFSYQDALLKLYKSDQDLDFIPGSIPFEISSDLGTYDYIPTSYRHTIKFTITDGGNEILSENANVSALADQEALISYEAATADDQNILDTFDTMYDVEPLSLVKVVPTLKVRGEIIAQSTESSILGHSQNYKLEFIAPEREMGGIVKNKVKKTIEKDLHSGISEAFAFNTDRVIPSALRPNGDTESGSFYEDQKLYRTGVDYLYRLQSTHNELAQISGGDFTNTATSASISNGVVVSYANDNPYSFEWIGLRINAYAAIRYFNRLAEDINDNKKEFSYIYGLQGSHDESDIFEDTYEVESVATVKGLKLVAAGNFPGITMKKITEANESDINMLAVSSSMKDVFHDAIDDGQIIYTPSSPVAYVNWNGLFYIVIDPEVGDGTYAIGEGLNGAYTVEQFPDGWENFWRENLTINLEATIHEPDNDDEFIKGEEDIYWHASYDSLINDWEEIGYIDTSDLPIGLIRLYSGYGTDAYVDVEIEEDEVMLIGDQYNTYDKDIIKYEDEFGIPRGLLKSIIHKESWSDPFEPNQYRYEPGRDYTDYSGTSPVHPLTTHPYKQHAIAGHTLAGMSITEGSQFDDLNPDLLQIVKSRESGGWSLRGIKEYAVGQTFAQVQANDTPPGSQGWLKSIDISHPIQNPLNREFTAQMILSASYGMSQVLYESALTLAKDMNGNLWFDKSTSGIARNIYDMNDPETSIHLAASVLRYKYNNDLVKAAVGNCGTWYKAVWTYNGSPAYADNTIDGVCTVIYPLYKP